MKHPTATIAAVVTALLAVGIVQGQQKKTPGEGFAAVPGLKGGQDVFGPYDPVQNWPKPLSESLPNHEGWTWSQATDVFRGEPRPRVRDAEGRAARAQPGARDHLASADRAEHQVSRRRRLAGA